MVSASPVLYAQCLHLLAVAAKIVTESMFFVLANGTIVVSLFVSSLTKDESKRPKYRELLVSSWTSIHIFMN